MTKGKKFPWLKARKSEMGVEGDAPSRPMKTGGMRTEEKLARDGLRSAAEPLDPQTRAALEARFDRDFSQVRVHSDSRAAQSADELQARAYTIDQHIVFGPGERPARKQPLDELLVHEAAHTVQQADHPGHEATPGLRISDREGLAEREAEAAVHGKMGGTYAKRNQALSPTPLQISAQFSDPRIGGNTSGTQPPYSIDDVRKRLATFNLGPIKGTDVVKKLSTASWKVFFWKTKGQMGQADAGKSLILLPREASLLGNVNTLFHESIHALSPVPGAGGSVRNLSRVWANLEEEVKAQYQEILFLKAHEQRDPALVAASTFKDDWSKIQKMNTGQLYQYFKWSVIPWVLFGHTVQYRFLLKKFQNDASKIVESPEVAVILNRILLGWGPSPEVKPPAPARPKFKPLVPRRSDFNKEMRKSIEEAD